MDPNTLPPDTNRPLNMVAPTPMPPVPPVDQSSGTQSNDIAVAALICSLLGIIIFILGIIGFILGIISLKKSKRLQGKGRGLSIASIIIGFLTGFAAFALLVIFLAVPSLQKGAWYRENSSQFTTQTQKLSGDVSNIDQDIKNQDLKSLQTDCQTLKTDTVSIKKIPTYPTITTASKISQGEKELTNGASDCLDSISEQSPTLLSQAVNELSSGINDLQSVHATVTTR